MLGIYTLMKVTRGISSGDHRITVGTVDMDINVSFVDIFESDLLQNKLSLVTWKLVGAVCSNIRIISCRIHQCRVYDNDQISE